MEKMNRYYGCLLGLAVGDALGTTLEFKPPGTFKPVNDMVGGGPFNLEPGQWTDDTSMALCLAESLVESRGFNPADQMQRYLRWYREGHLSRTGRCFDIGTTTRSAMHHFERSGEPFNGSTDANTAGNGSLMRLAPVPMFYAAHPEEAMERSGESSRTTHGANVCMDACRCFGGLIVGALKGIEKDELLSDHYAPIPGYWKTHSLIPQIDGIAAGSFKKKNPPEIRGTGYVVQFLEAALWAFYQGQTFEEGCLMAVNLGDDADTTGAIYGQIAGAYYGEGGIPEAWLKKIYMKKEIQALAEKMFR